MNGCGFRLGNRCFPGLQVSVEVKLDSIADLAGYIVYGVTYISLAIPSIE